jgi:hypothetical protein
MVSWEAFWGADPGTLVTWSPRARAPAKPCPRGSAAEDTLGTLLLVPRETAPVPWGTKGGTAPTGAGPAHGTCLN